MSKSFGRIRRFFTTLALTLGVALALPGCGKVQTPQEMSTDVANNTDSFADALKKKDLERMYQIRDEAKDKYKDLDDEENRRIDNGDDITEVMAQRTLLDNQIIMYDDVINKFEQNNNTIPKNSSLSGKIGDGVNYLTGHALDFLDGDPVYDTTAIATEYAKEHTDYEGIAKSDRELFQTWYGEDFYTVQEAKGTFGKNIMDKLKKLAYLVGGKTQELRDAFRQGLIDEAKKTGTDQYGNQDVHIYSDEELARLHRAEIEDKVENEVREEVEQEIRDQVNEDIQKAYDEGKIRYVRMPDGTYEIVPVPEDEWNENKDNEQGDYPELG